MEIDVSVVIPVKDEEKTLLELADGIRKALDGSGKTYELIFIDDGSVDDGLERMKEIRSAFARTRIIRFVRNFGKSAALAAGFERSRGNIIITIDADLQDDPSEIPRFIEAIEQGFHLVTGWKMDRKDPMEKKVLSRIANWVTNKASGIQIHDMNCGFKAYQRQVTENIRLYGDLHRFIPTLAAAKGFTVTEIPVKHHPRRHGKSKYGLERVPRGFFDLLTVIFLTQYAKRPLHLFGGIGVSIGAVGFAALAYLTALWLMGMGPIGTRPLFMGGVMLMLLGAQLLSIGLVGELITHMSFRQGEQYVVLEELGHQ